MAQIPIPRLAIGFIGMYEPGDAFLLEESVHIHVGKIATSVRDEIQSREPVAHWVVTLFLSI